MNETNLTFSRKRLALPRAIEVQRRNGSAKCGVGCDVLAEDEGGGRGLRVVARGISIAAPSFIPRCGKGGSIAALSL